MKLKKDLPDGQQSAGDASVTVAGIFSDARLSTRLADICSLNGWRISYWHTGSSVGHISWPVTSAAPDIVLFDQPHTLSQIMQSDAQQTHATPELAQIVLAQIELAQTKCTQADGQPHAAAANAIVIADTLSDSEILHQLTTALNVARFQQQFFCSREHNQQPEPITQLPSHEELLEYMNRYTGTPMGLVLLQINHADHLYSNLDPVSRTDLLGALSKHVSSLLNADTHLGIFDAACFIVWYPLAQEQQVAQLAHSFTAQSHTSLDFKQGSLQFTCSIGFAHTHHLAEPLQLWQQAWHNKQTATQATGNHCVGSPSADALSQRIPAALSRDEFSLVLQPQWRTTEDRLVGVETLLRWQGMDVGNISPDHFIPIAERNGQMSRVGDWVLERAACESATWLEHLLDPIQLGINVSPQQFHNDAIRNQLTRLSKDRWLDPAILELELSHENLLRVVDHDRATLYQLKDMGVRIAIDNLGMHVVDTKKLLRCPADTLKLDRSMIAQIESEPHAQRLAEQICQLGEKFSLRVVAVGVETEGQRQILQNAGCTDMQGYLFNAPVALEHFHEFLADNRCRTDEPGHAA